MSTDFELHQDTIIFPKSTKTILKESLVLETFYAIIEHLVYRFESRETQFENLATIHAMRVVISFFVATSEKTKSF